MEPKISDWIDELLHVANEMKDDAQKRASMEMLLYEAVEELKKIENPSESVQDIIYRHDELNG